MDYSQFSGFNSSAAQPTSVNALEQSMIERGILANPVGTNSANKVQVRSTSRDGMPNSADYYVNSTDYEANAFERFGDWLTGNDRNAQYQSAQQLASMQYQDAYNRWLAQREDSQFQRMVKDLKKAGLNPWLAVQNGFTGSQSDGVSAAKTSAVKLDKKTNIMDFLGNLLTTALSVATIMGIAKLKKS